MAVFTAPALAAPWLGPALRAQTAAAAALAGGFCCAGLLGAQFGTPVQLALLLGGMVLVGVPHGAFDHLVAQSVLEPRFGSRWRLAFTVGYAALAALVGFAWATVPVLTMLVFLAMSVVHFGLGDVEDGLAPSRDAVPRAVSAAAYGAMPILLPSALHPAETAPVLAALAGVPTEGMEAALRGTVWLLPLWGAAFGWSLLAAYRERRPVTERTAMAAGFVALPPLLAFALYFTAGHSVRHVLRLGAWHDPRRPGPALRWLAATLVPAAALSAAALAGLAWIMEDAGTALLTPIFRTIAALTLPHMLVTAWLEEGGGDSAA